MRSECSQPASLVTYREASITVNIPFPPLDHMYPSGSTTISMQDGHKHDVHLLRSSAQGGDPGLLAEDMRIDIGRFRCAALLAFLSIILLVQLTDSPTTEAAKVEAEACQRPYRDVRHKLFSSIPIQVITALAVLLRMYSRWEVSKAFESDDWIMVVCLVCDRSLDILLSISVRL